MKTGRPKLLTRPKEVQASLDADDVAYIDGLARTHATSRSAIIRRIIRDARLSLCPAVQPGEHTPLANTCDQQAA